MKEQTKLLNANFNFNIEDIGNNSYKCSDLSDRTITIDIQHNSSLYVTNKFGQKEPAFNSERYVYTTVFKKSGFTFTYSVSHNSSMGLSMGFVPLAINERIQNTLKTCYLNFVSEEYFKNALSYFKNHSDNLVFGRKVTDGLPHFTLDVKVGSSFLHKSYLYDDVTNTIYEKKDNKSGKFHELFDGVGFSMSWFFFYESIDSDAFKFNIFDRKEKAYVWLQYESGVLQIRDAIVNTTQTIEGDDNIYKKINEYVNSTIIKTPTPKLEKYVKAYNLDLSQLTLNDFKVLNMADY